MHYYRAPWDSLLKRTTIIVLVFLAGITMVVLRNPYLPDAPKMGIPAIAVATVALCWAFAPRGYEIEGNRLIIRQNLGSKEYDLRGLQNIETSANAMPLLGAVRVFGVGGLFGYYGRYYRSGLGFFTAWVTDRSRTVVLKFAGRTVVISPDDPKAFTDEIRTVVPVG